MALPESTATYPGSLTTATGSPGAAAPASAVSWGAIFAGAAGAAALSMLLLILGVGLGLSSVSPWSGSGIGAGTFGLSTILWLTFTQLAASGMGGYQAGRLRARWTATQADEVYFRDTAHGFLSWAIASLATAVLLGSVIGSIVGAGAQAGASVIGGVTSAAGAATGGAAMGAVARSGDGNGAGVGGMNPASYSVDQLFRRVGNAVAAPAATSSASAVPAADAASGAATGAVPAAATSAPTLSSSAPSTAGDGTAPPTAEVGRIIANALRTGSLAPDDTRYLGQLIAQRTGLSTAEAERRVTEVFGRLQTSVQNAETAAKEAADKARQASAVASLWLFVSLLIGAFVASWAATFGGRQRDL